MQCIYYARPENVDRILAAGIDPTIAEHPSVATDERFVNLFPMVLLNLTKEWKTFAWRYDQFRIRDWVPIMVDIFPRHQLCFRPWGSQEPHYQSEGDLESQPLGCQRSGF